MGSIEARCSLTLLWLIARMDDNSDAKQILNSSPSVHWKSLLECLWMSWMKTVHNDLDTHRLSWTEAVDLTQNDHSEACW